MSVSVSNQFTRDDETLLSQKNIKQKGTLKAKRMLISAGNGKRVRDENPEAVEDYRNAPIEFIMWNDAKTCDNKRTFCKSDPRTRDHFCKTQAFKNECE
jgi:hypothetical protein